MEIEATFICAYCFETIDTTVDISGGMHQKYVEDCQVCCRPNALTIVIDEDLEGAEITAEVS